MILARCYIVLLARRRYFPPAIIIMTREEKRRRIRNQLLAIRFTLHLLQIRETSKRQFTRLVVEEDKERMLSNTKEEDIRCFCAILSPQDQGMLLTASQRSIDR